MKNSHHVTGPDKKPLPDRVKVVFYSYTEKQFYRGDFELPYEKILSLFRQAYIDEPNKPYYRAIMIGIAPGGAVSVWLKGSRTTEVFFGHAEKIDVDPSNGFNLPFDSKAESDAYIQKQLVNVLDAEELESLKKMVFHSGLGRGIVIYTNGRRYIQKKNIQDKKKCLLTS